MLVCRHPAPPLAAHVDSIWSSTREALSHSRERSLPTGRADIVIPLLQDSVVRFDSVDSTEAHHLRGAVVSGAHDRWAVRGMGGASSVIGVHFKPGGAAAFLGGALRDVRNQTVLLEDLWGPAARELRERLQVERRPERRVAMLEAALLSRLSLGSPPDPIVTHALGAFARDASAARIDRVRAASNCSPQQFIRRFEAAVGLTPKRYARVLRFNAVLARLAGTTSVDWAQVAAEGGYGDQSHLIHEFQRLAGMTPTAYVPVRAEQPTHVAIGNPPARPAARKN